jgi:hypothetical protein
MQARHEAARGPDGKSRLAVEAGRLGGLRSVERHGSGSAWGIRMALRRWHGVPLRAPQSLPEACDG